MKKKIIIAEIILLTFLPTALLWHAISIRENVKPINDEYTFWFNYDRSDFSDSRMNKFLLEYDFSSGKGLIAFNLINSDNGNHYIGLTIPGKVVNESANFEIKECNPIEPLNCSNPRNVKNKHPKPYDFQHYKNQTRLSLKFSNAELKENSRIFIYFNVNMIPSQVFKFWDADSKIGTGPYNEESIRFILGEKYLCKGGCLKETQGFIETSGSYGNIIKVRPVEDYDENRIRSFKIINVLDQNKIVLKRIYENFILVIWAAFFTLFINKHFISKKASKK